MTVEMLEMQAFSLKEKASFIEYEASITEGAMAVKLETFGIEQ